MLSLINNVQISHCHLRSRLVRLQMCRRLQFSDPVIAVNFISDQMKGPGRVHCFRMMHYRGTLEGQHVTQDLVFFHKKNIYFHYNEIVSFEENGEKKVVIFFWLLSAEHQLPSVFFS